MNKPILLILFIIIGLNANAGFVKISERGKLLNNNAKKWSCVLDNRTNLIWEVKSTEEGLQNYENTYTWFDIKIHCLSTLLRQSDLKAN